MGLMNKLYGRGRALESSKTYFCGPVPFILFLKKIQTFRFNKTSNKNS